MSVVKRKLPSHSNPLLTENIPSFDELVDLRRLGQTKLYNSKAGADAPAVLFSYVHLRAPLPADINPEIFGSGSGSKPEAYFLMRRSKDGFVSSTGMFKASFPMATKLEEDAERHYVKANFHTSAEETAGNLWIHPEDAVTLSSHYNCRVWVEALVDNKTVQTDSRSRAVTPPPLYKPINDSQSGDSPAQSTTTAYRQNTRSASPNKRRRGGRPLKQQYQKEPSSLKQEVNAETPEPTSEKKESRSVRKCGDLSSNGDIAQELPTQSNTSGRQEHPFTVEVERLTETKGDVKVESAHVKVEVATSEHPVGLESPEEMIAKAKEMVAEAMKAEENAEPAKSKKRKVDDLKSSTDNDEPDQAENADAAIRAKRAKLLEGALTEKFRKRAIIGLGATIALGVTSVAIPYLL